MGIGTRCALFVCIVKTVALAFFVVKGAFEFSLFHKAKECVYYIGGKLSSRNFLDYRNSFFKLKVPAVRAVGIHSVKAVCYGDYLCHTGDIFSRKTVGIAFSVGALMMSLSTYGKIGYALYILQKLVSV